MIVIHCPLKQDYIIELLVGSNETFRVSFVKKEGIRLYFNIDCPDVDQAIAYAKEKIKSTEIGKVLYFQVTAA